MSYLIGDSIGYLDSNGNFQKEKIMGFRSLDFSDDYVVVTSKEDGEGSTWYESTLTQKINDGEFTLFPASNDYTPIYNLNDQIEDKVNNEIYYISFLFEGRVYLTTIDQQKTIMFTDQEMLDFFEEGAFVMLPIGTYDENNYTPDDAIPDNVIPDNVIPDNVNTDDVISDNNTSSKSDSKGWGVALMAVGVAMIVAYN